MKSTSFFLAACLALALAAGASFAQAQTLTFTVETSTSGGQAVVPRLTWTTAPAGATCTATTTPAAVLPALDPWVGSKLASGTQILPAISASRSFAIVCAWGGSLTGTVAFTAPTQNTNGSTLTDLAGFRIQYGTSAANLDQSAYVQNPALRTWTSPALAPGIWYFGMRAFNTAGLESALSNVMTKTMTAGTSQSRTLEVVVLFPGSPVLTGVQ